MGGNAVEMDMISSYANASQPLRRRRRLHSTLALAISLTLFLLLFPACDGGSSAIEDMMHLLPREAAGVVYVDVAALYDDDDLRPLQVGAEGEWGNAGFEDAFGIELADLTEVVFSETNGYSVFLLVGLEDLVDLRDELDDLDYDEDEIEDVEVWIDTSRPWEALAFLDGDRVLIAENEETMEDVLRPITRESSSLYHQVEHIVPEVPSGVLVVVTDCGRDCLAASALQKKSSDEMTYVQISLYEDEDDAEDAEEDAKDDIEDDDLPSDCSDADVNSKGPKVTYELVCNLDFFDFFINFDF